MKSAAVSPSRSIIVIGAASGAGAPDPATAEGPGALRHYRVFHNTPLQQVKWDAILRVPREKQDTPLHAVTALDARLATAVEAVLRAGNFPLVVGGDHSCAIGTWSGVHRALQHKGSLGLIWIDAHMDSHTFATTPSGQIHGMPLACLLGHGAAILTAIGGMEAKLRSTHVCLIGVRSYEAGEAALLHRLGVRVFDMDEVRRRGLAAVFGVALAIVRNGTAGFGVSVDLDALDPEEEPGVGTPVPGGLRRAELAAALSHLRGDPAFVAMEIVEYNPRRDRGHVTADAAGALLDAITPLK
jgi:arginase